MAEPVLITDQLNKVVDALHERIANKPWRNQSRQGFIYNLKQTREHLSELESLLKSLRSHQVHEGKPESRELTQHLNELRYLSEVLEMNQQMEEEINSRAAEEEGFELDVQMKPNDAHSVLEQRVLSTLLKTRYLTERIQLEHKKENASSPGIGNAQNHLLTLLEKKETELQALREQYESLRNRSYLGKLDSDTSADREMEWADLTRNLVGEHTALSSDIRRYREQVEALNALHGKLEQRFSALEELSERHAQETNELVRTLKKERDYAKRIVTDIEHETVKLRGQYSKELLGLENEKSRIRDSAQQRVKKRVLALEKALADKSEQLERLYRKLNAASRPNADKKSKGRKQR